MKKVLGITLALLTFILLTSGCADRQDNLQHEVVKPIWFTSDIGHDNSYWPFDSEHKPPYKHNKLFFVDDQDIVNIIDRDIERSEGALYYFETEVERLENEGEDINLLTNRIGEFRKHLENAKMHKALSDELSQNNENSQTISTEQREYLFNAIKELRIIHELLPQIFNDKQIMKPGQVKLKDDVYLNASGNGTAVLSGNIDMTLSVQNAVVTIMDENNDKIFSIEGQYTTEGNINPKIVAYRNVNGTMDIIGTSTIVMVRGQSINIKAIGDGFAALSGNGTYTYEEGNGTIVMEWMPHLFIGKRQSI
ncbi:hypothetical protein [Methanococcoides burtonii]|uniref:Uncharacterized protein n=1 Tax=Methanococcoides burtonii (strain DSM 6242 / NBRC 107633 / OCM 468 / ACE-M) TaxID=259564 RepID=Q12US5_METBU|nr:hypothetical protein [Methanococcoides burtonii]ABE52801.1 Hypothetical protein Mbur_1919 [Methanococcoides burtonii DSM 6242]